jgi:hypothetical protein
MSDSPTQETIRQLVSKWLPPHQVPRRFRIHTDTSDFFRVEFDDVVSLGNRLYLIRHNAKEQRFGLEDEVKFWVKRAIDLSDGSLKIMKLVFYERFMSHIGDIEFECFRSPKKEARILDLVHGHKNFMQGYAIHDEKENVIRVLDVIKGQTLAQHVGQMNMNHEAYYHEVFPDRLARFLECIEAIRFLHENGERHGDIRRDHVLIDQSTGDYRWIDFDFNYRHRENIYGYDLFGLGNIVVFLVGMGDVLVPDLVKQEHPCLDKLNEMDLNIVFSNRVVNLKKIYPYIPESLNRVLMHFSKGANRFYEHTDQLLYDLNDVRLVQ